MNWGGRVSDGREPLEGSLRVASDEIVERCVNRVDGRAHAAGRVPHSFNCGLKRCGTIDECASTNATNRSASAG